MSAIDKEALRWVVRKSDRELETSEAEAFDAWYATDIRHQGAYLRATAINKALDQATVQETLRPGLEHLEAEWAGVAWKRPRSRRAFLGYGGMAAGVALLAITAMLPTATDTIVLTTAKGEYRKVLLADSSVVSINGGSQMEVKLTRSARQIDLRCGEAWFEVAKDRSRPFIVAADGVRARAIGTAFAVRRSSEGAEIMVTEGTVEVWAEDGSAEKRVVHAGEQAFVAKQASDIDARRDPREIERKLAWREGRLVFRNQTLEDAVADFNRYSTRRIVIVDPRLKSKTLVGQYQIDAPERFAKDVSIFLNVPVSMGVEAIAIGDATAR